MNRIILSGRLTRDPDFSQMQNGKSMCKFTLAVDRGYKGANGESKTDFIPCVSFNGNTPNFIAQYFHKGDGMMIEGSMTQNDYTNKDGAQVHSFQVNVDKVEFPLSRRDNSGGQQGGYQQPQNNYGQPQQPNYNQAPPPQQSYQQPAPHQQPNYNQAPPPQQSYHQPAPPPQPNYNQAPPPQQSYQQPAPPQQSNYNQAPPMTENDFGVFDSFGDGEVPF